MMQISTKVSVSGGESWFRSNSSQQVNHRSTYPQNPAIQTWHNAFIDKNASDISTALVIRDIFGFLKILESL